jgi:HlyD family type I secretion membrane fusion protein
MKLDFLDFGGGAGAAVPRSRRIIDRRMRQLDVVPLDHADKVVRVGLIAAGAFVGLFVLFGLLAPISSAAIAPGEVVVSGNRLVVQPITSGLVSEILVQEGQSVRAGQPLVRLNGIRSGAQLKQAQARRDALVALRSRLVAERDGLAEIAFPADLGQRAADPGVSQLLQAQRSLFARHGALLGADRGTAEMQLVAARARHAAAERQLALINDELEGFYTLYKKGFARKTTIRSLERTAAQLNADRISGAAAVREAEIQQARVRDQQVSDIVGQLNSVDQQLAQVTPQLDVNRYLADRDVLKAPVAGRVSGIAAIGPGTVIGGGKTLMEIVPSGRTLIVEARVKPQDIDDVRLGQEATVRFTSVNPHGKTAFKGKIITLSPDRIAGEGAAYYKAQIAIDDPSAAKEDGLTLQPGIPASVTIKTQDRTMIDYFMAPFSDAVSRAFREE